MQNTSLLRRLASMLYDAILLLAVWVITILVFIGINRGEAIETYENLPLQIALSVVTYVFFVGYWIRVGRTLGMQSWGLQLQTANDEKPSLAAASVRFFAAILSWAPAGLGFLWQLWDKDKLAWHDRISGTRLVHYPKPKK